MTTENEKKLQGLERLTFTTLKQCSAVTGWPVPVLKRCKAAGCPAFRHSKIYFEQVPGWYFCESNLALDDGVDWGRALKKAQAQREQIKLAEDERRVIDFAQVADFHRQLVGVLFQDLQRIFCDELPSSLRGRDEISIRTRCDGEIERLKSLLRNRLENWTSSHAPPAKTE